jgi:glycosyltransferase involved in cell wall biosynthesis
MGKPRIYIAVSEFYPSLGGTEQQARMQARLLRERGFETTVVTFRLGRSWRRRDAVDGVPVIRVAGWLLVDREKRPGLLRQLSYLMGMAVMGWILWHRRRHYDVLHVYKLNVLALAAAIVCRLTGRPMVVVVRSAGLGDTPHPHSDTSWLAAPSNGGAPTARALDRLRMGGDLEDLARMGRGGVRLTRYLLRQNQAVVVGLSTRCQRDLVMHRFDLPGMQLIPNGVDITRFAYSSTTPHQDERARTVICVSKLRYEKGIDVLLQAWRLVHDEAPQARLIIVGDGPLRTPLEHLAHALDVADCVEFTGRQADVPAQLHRAGLAVLSSRFEGMPNAVLEAMACGLPCVATCVSGSEDIIRHGANGLLVEPEDVEGLAQALLAMLRDPELARTYGRAARTTIEEHYALEPVVARYEELYLRLAGNQPAHL